MGLSEGPKILMGLAFAVMLGIVAAAFLAGVPLPFINETQGSVLGFFEQAMALMGC